jgi:uncharacterized membrane protein
MSSSKSIFGLVLPAAALLIGLAAGSAARAEPMKPEDIESNRQSCMLACSQQVTDAARCKSYCDCSTKAMGEQVSLEEYNAGKVAIANGKQPPQVTVDKLTAIAKSCKAQLQ